MIQQEDSKLSISDPKAELLRWHHRLGHISFKAIRLLAAVGVLPKRLLQARIPKYAACQYGLMTRKPWRSKAAPSKIKPTIVRHPSDCISVDQMESIMPGFMAQMKGRLTRQRYNNATIFIDHRSRLKFVHLQESIPSRR